jgi:hypothetical protein
VHGFAAQCAQHSLQRVVAHDLVVAVGQQQHRRQVADASTNVTDHVQRGLIRPVDILDRQHSRSPWIR